MYSCVELYIQIYPNMKFQLIISGNLKMLEKKMYSCVELYIQIYPNMEFQLIISGNLKMLKKKILFFK